MNKNIFAFYGADHKAGCTMISQCIAEKISADNPETDILLLHCSRGRGCEFSPFAAFSMESIKPYLDENLVNIESIRSSAHYRSNLYIIGGDSASPYPGDIHPDKAMYLADALASSFGIVICDCGAEINDGLAIGTMMSSCAVYAVFTQSESAIKRFEWQKDLFRKLGIPVKGYIVNRFRRKSPCTKSYFCERLGLSPEEVFTIRDSGFGELCESEERSILSYKEIGFSRDIGAAAESIMRFLTLEQQI